MTVYLGIDDTDTPESRGTGRLARMIAAELAETYRISGVTRHQLYVHPDIPYTSHNSAAVIHIEGAANGSLHEIFTAAREMIRADFIDGSDPGICIAADTRAAPDLLSFGMRAKSSVVTQKEARSLARQAGITLEGLGGTNDGVIGALAGVGLAASRNDGRFVVRGDTRDLSGSQTVAALLGGGVDSVMTAGGLPVTEGVVELRKFPKPALRQGRAVLYVEDAGGVYRDLVVG
ncbi:ABC transporter substrate-binding protein [Methanoculleus sp. FWC-SCC1]|uniref:ABC transporter substrate-binding protein n=1 Tax=Methanoculleus frigidifontis TaxID=2584085 RepID=A0ABT8MCE4_9EURY|nr:ABC transporter substrate-binding protein [Methanoculleus sp. FWC-SCC1]MDN7025598.1 ABC transporter substrate-binding protein [Methanoculleus sp. FWC-SCC1]